MTTASEVEKSTQKLRSNFQWIHEVKTILVAMRLGETPVHIPNTMVKTQTADDTILETVWESRWLPDYNGLIAQPVRAHA